MFFPLLDSMAFLSPLCSISDYVISFSMSLVVVHLLNSYSEFVSLPPIPLSKCFLCILSFSEKASLTTLRMHSQISLLLLYKCFKDLSMWKTHRHYLCPIRTESISSLGK